MQISHSHNTLISLFSSGTIELHELQQVMRKLGQNPSEAELIEMISTVDDNGDNEIDFEEFMILMKSRIGEKDPEKELRDAFRVFDTDNSGSIDKKELKRLMKKLGQALSEAELDAMMDEVDTNGDGEISFEEFKELMVRRVIVDVAFRLAFAMPCAKKSCYIHPALTFGHLVRVSFNRIRKTGVCAFWLGLTMCSTTVSYLSTRASIKSVQGGSLLSMYGYFTRFFYVHIKYRWFPDFLFVS